MRRRHFPPMATQTIVFRTNESTLRMMSLDQQEMARGTWKRARFLLEQMQNGKRLPVLSYERFTVSAKEIAFVKFTLISWYVSP